MNRGIYRIANAFKHIVTSRGAKLTLIGEHRTAHVLPLPPRVTAGMCSVTDVQIIDVAEASSSSDSGN